MKQCNPKTTTLMVSSYTIMVSASNKHSRSQLVCTEHFQLKAYLPLIFLNTVSILFYSMSAYKNPQALNPLSGQILSYVVQYLLSSCKIIHKAYRGVIIQTELVPVLLHYLDNNTSHFYISAVSHTKNILALLGLDQVIIDNLVYRLF